jgi:dihydrofolate reductase/thymidylate synthase
VYGFQWRHFGADYKGAGQDYTGQGVDQLKNVIELIKTEPDSRRIILSAWNPKDLTKMALPPCHMMCQFYVHDGRLSCRMNQRSGDMGLGVPFNIASYSLLTCMIAQVCGLRPGEFVHEIGDAHVYANHVEALETQLTREPFPFPRLELDPSITDIDHFTMDHITLVGYKHHKTIKMKMAV